MQASGAGREVMKLGAKEGVVVVVLLVVVEMHH